MGCENAGSVKLLLVSGAWPNSVEDGIVLDVSAGQWNEFHVDLAAFDGMDLTAVNQIKFDSQSGSIGADKTALTDFYMDNMYFGDTTPTVGTPVLTRYLIRSLRQWLRRTISRCSRKRMVLR